MTQSRLAELCAAASTLPKGRRGPLGKDFDVFKNSLLPTPEPMPLLGQNCVGPPKYSHSCVSRVPQMVKMFTFFKRKISAFREKQRSLSWGEGCREQALDIKLSHT